MSPRTKSIKEASQPEEKKPEVFSRRNYLSSGCTLLNMALSGNPHGAFQKGCYYYFVGDSSSGKTFLTLTAFAEATISKPFKNHRLIFDDVENGALMDLEKFFGKTVAERMEPPRLDDEGLPLCSDSIEDFYFNVDDAFKDGRPFIYVLDSMDSLTSEKEADEFEEGKKLSRSGKGTKGSYGDGKAKKNSAGLRTLVTKLKKTESILIIISQTRDNIGFGAQFNPKTRSGGRALKFYATAEIWTAIKGTISKTVKGTKRSIGKIIEIGIKKNRQTGREHKVETLIYPSYGIEDTESCINYLMSEGHWSKTTKGVDAPEFDHKGTIKTLISKIDEEGRESELRNLVGKVWNAIDEACAIKRKKRYE